MGENPAANAYAIPFAKKKLEEDVNQQKDSSTVEEAMVIHQSAFTLFCLKILMELQVPLAPFEN